MSSYDNEILSRSINLNGLKRIVFLIFLCLKHFPPRNFAESVFLNSILSDRELRTFAAKLHELPLYLEVRKYFSLG